MKVLCIDIGTKKHGFAIGYTDSKLTIPFLSLDAKGIKKDIQVFIKLIKDEKIERVIIGKPARLNGSDNEMTKVVLEYNERLKNSLMSNAMSEVEIILVPETLTSKEAEKILIEQGILGKKNRKVMIDALAAKIILDDYLSL